MRTATIWHLSCRHLVNFAALFLLALASASASAAVLLAASFAKNTAGGSFGPFGPTTPVVIIGTLTNVSSTDTLTLCEGICLGDSSTYSVGGLSSASSGYSFYFGNNPSAPFSFDGQFAGPLGPGLSKDFIFGVFEPDPGLAQGRYGFFTQIQVFDATPERNFLTAASFGGSWLVPEPGSLALVVLALGGLMAMPRRGTA